MKIQGVNKNNSLYIKPNFKSNPKITIPIVKSLKKERAGIFGFLSAAFTTFMLQRQEGKEKKQKLKELAEFEKTKKIMENKAPTLDIRKTIYIWMTQDNVDLFKWILEDEKNGGEVAKYIEKFGELRLNKVEAVFRDEEIPRDDISGILNNIYKISENPTPVIRQYKYNVQQLKKINAILDNIKPQNETEKRNLNAAKKYYSAPAYSYMYDEEHGWENEENLKFVIKNMPLSEEMEMILEPQTEECMKLRLDFAKHLDKQNLLKKFHNSAVAVENDELVRKMYLFRNINSPQKLDFAKFITSKKIYSYDELCNLMNSITNQNSEIAKEICSDRRFVQETRKNFDIHSLLEEISGENVDIVKEIYDKTKNYKQIKSVLERAVETHRSTIKLCESLGIPIELVSGRNVVNPENALLIKNVIDKYVTLNKNLDKKNQYSLQEIQTLAKLCKSKQANELVKALILDDKSDKPLSPKGVSKILQEIFEYDNEYRITLRPSAQKFSAIISVAKDEGLTSKSKYEILSDCKDKPIEFAAQLLKQPRFENQQEKEYISEIFKETNKENVQLARTFCFNENIPLDDIKTILANNTEDVKKYTRNQIEKIINSGEYKKNDWLKDFQVDTWSFILSSGTNLDTLPVLYRNNLGFFVESGNPHILKLHKEFEKDVYANKHLLKSGIDDLSEEDLDDFCWNIGIISALGLVGKSNLESMFPRTLADMYEFGDAVYYSGINLTDYKDKLSEKIYPQNTEKYIKLEKEVRMLKKVISELAGNDIARQKENLDNSADSIFQEIKCMKKELSVIDIDNPKTAALKHNINQLTKQLNQKRKEVKDLYAKSPNYAAIKKAMSDIEQKQREMSLILKSKVDLSPQDIITKTWVIAGFLNAKNLINKKVKGESKGKKIDIEKAIYELIDLIKPVTKENEEKWNKTINQYIFKMIGIPYDKKLSDKLDLIHSKYISQMFVSDEQFFNSMKKLVSTIQSGGNKSIEEIIDNMNCNVETKAIFEKLGVDYEKYTKVDKNSYTKVNIELDSSTAKLATIENLEEDLNDEMFTKIPKEEIKKLKTALKDGGYVLKKDEKVLYDEVGTHQGKKEFYKLYKDNEHIKFEDLHKIISIIKETFNNGDFWSVENDDSEIEQAREHIYYHIMKMRTVEINNAENIKEKEKAEIEIRKVDMYDIKKSISLGNDANCCTGLGERFNEWSAPTYIMSKCIGAFELSDKGNSVGNTMFYLAKVDGKLSLILDNIELKSKYQYNDAIKGAFIDYAKKFCAEIGKPNISIYAGPNRHKIDLSDKNLVRHTIQPLGISKGDVYLDILTGEYEFKNKTDLDLFLYKLA